MCLDANRRIMDRALRVKEVILAENCHGVGSQFLEQAEAEFRAGALLQASEKAWGAFVHCVKAIAQEKGWEHSSHRHLNCCAGQLLRGISPDHVYLLGVVNALHANFYEDFYEADAVGSSIEASKMLVNALWASSSEHVPSSEDINLN